MSGWGWTWDTVGRRDELYLVDERLYIRATLRPLGSGRGSARWEYETRSTRGQSDFVSAISTALAAVAQKEHVESLRDAAIAYVKGGRK